MFKKVLRRVAIGLAVIIVVLAGVQLYLLRGTPGKAITPTNSSVKYSATPTLLIPGWGGNTWTYTKLIDYYQDQNIATNVMVVRVAPTGAVQVSGSLKGKQNPLIQFIYDWNYSTTYQPQVRELTQVLQVLAAKYHVQKLNVIAHSYGGTELLHAYIGSKTLQREIALQKVVFLGVPVDESFGTNTKYTKWLFKKSHDQMFKTMLKEVKEAQLPRGLVFYNWMGSDEGKSTTDGEVPQIQSLMLKTLIKHKHVHYHQHIFTDTTHTELHQRVKIIKKIAHVIWGKE